MTSLSLPQGVFGLSFDSLSSRSRSSTEDSDAERTRRMPPVTRPTSGPSNATIRLGSRDLEQGVEVGESSGACPCGDDPLIGAVIADRYRVLDRIGRGGIGLVYKVEHAAIGKPLAMKLLSGLYARDPEMERRFRREAIAVSKLESPNTVQVFDFGSWSGLTYLVMELVRGDTLGSIIARSGPLEPARALKIALQVCASLGEAHRAGIVHRDVKPDNIMITARDDGSDMVKVLDFGLAKLEVASSTFAFPGGPLADNDANAVTTRGMVLGTPHYMAPEQIRGDAVDGRADIYGLGGALYRAITGALPFEGKAADVLQRSLVERPKTLAERGGFSKSLSDLIARAMHRNPAKRFQTADEMRAEIARELDRIDEAERVEARRIEAEREALRAADAQTFAADDVSIGRPSVEGASRTVDTRDAFESARDEDSNVDSYEARLRRARMKRLVPFAVIIAAVLLLAGGFLWALAASRSASQTGAKSSSRAALDQGAGFGSVVARFGTHESAPLSTTPGHAST